MDSEASSEPVYTSRIDRLRILASGVIGFGIAPTLVPIVENVFGGGSVGPASTFYLFFMAGGFVLAAFGIAALATSGRYPAKTDTTLVAMGVSIGNIISSGPDR